MIKNPVETKYNRTTRFILPALKLNEPLLLNNGLVNAYLQDHAYDVRWDDVGCIFLVLKPLKFDSSFESCADSIRNLSSYRDEYDIESGVVFVLEIPEKFKDILPKFKLGKYSEFNRQFVKECIPQYWKGKISKRWKIFYKDKSLKEEIEAEYNINIGNQEVENIPYAQDEIFRYNPEITTDLIKRDE